MKTKNKTFSLIVYLLGFILLTTISFSDVSVLLVPQTPSPENAKIEIIYPEDSEVKNSLPVRMEVRVSNYVLGEKSNFQRANELYDWDIGQSIRVIVDDKPFFAKVTQQIDPFNDEGIYFQKSYEFNLPEKISEGMHVIRAYLVRSFGESLKGKNTFDASTFYYKNKTPLQGINLKKPYLTINEPAVHHSYEDKKPILLDFYIKNCELTKDGYKVKLTIDKKIVRFLDRWSPYFIYGLRKGKHLIELQLVDANKKIVDGIFNNTSTQIVVR